MSTEPDNKKIRVMIVEDSPVMMFLMESIINADPRLEVVASVPSGELALKQIPLAKPDVISMDIRLPGMDGLETTLRIMQENPTPIVVVSSHVRQEELNISFNALKAGALSVLDKLPGLQDPDFDRQAQHLCTQLAIMSQVKVIRHRLRPNAPAVRARPRPMSADDSYAMLGVVASTGGPRALATLLNDLGPDFPLPILLVQHITTSFLPGFVDWLNSVSPLQAVLAARGEIPRPGRIYLPPADQHLVLRHGQLFTTSEEPVSYQRPSGTVLLNSMAQELGPKGIGMVLTGMGDDGASGLLAMREAGAYTLAEAASTAVVYGMPAVAARLDAAREILPIHEMGPHLTRLLFKS